jgi:predicted RNase H-like HicB family nuclease
LEYPAAVVYHDGHPISVVFPQFHGGIGSGETEEEALADAAYILAWCIYDTIQAGRPVPDPDEAAAKEQLGLEDVPYTRVSWASVKVHPELIDEDT